jgi:hypothetical protein
MPATETVRLRVPGQYATVSKPGYLAQGPIITVHPDGKVTINAGGHEETGMPN